MLIQYSLRGMCFQLYQMRFGPSILSAGFQPAILGLEIRCFMQLSYESV